MLSSIAMSKEIEDVRTGDRKQVHKVKKKKSTTQVTDTTEDEEVEVICSWHMYTNFLFNQSCK